MSSEGRRVERADEAVERVSAQDPKTTPQPKAPELDNIRRELDRAARQLDGLSKNLKRLNDRIKKAA